MNNHQLSRPTKSVAKKHAFATLLAFWSIGAIGLHAQNLAGGNHGVQVAVDWHTVAKPTYGTSYVYSWEDIHAYSKDGIATPMDLDLQVSQDDGGGVFTLLSQPITVPNSGMRITFDRHVVIHPSAAERGTLLPNDPQDKCKNQKDGMCRIVFNHRIAIVDAETGEVLNNRVEAHRFDVSRYQILNDIDDKGKVDIDLNAFANRQIRLRAIVIASYNGRGPSKPTPPTISPISSITRQDLK